MKLDSAYPPGDGLAPQNGSRNRRPHQFRPALKKRGPVPGGTWEPKDRYQINFP